jgi:hypothetical protein
VAFTDPTKPNQADYLTFIRGAGIGVAFLPDNSMWIDVSFTIAVDTVNDVLNVVNPEIYTLAAYNLGVDRLLNFAQDVEGQTFFATMREKLGLLGFAAGLVSSSSDQSSSQSLEVVEGAKRMTFTDLQLARTIWGRTYLGFAQQYGSTIWGLT